MADLFFEGPWPVGILGRSPAPIRKSGAVLTAGGVVGLRVLLGSASGPSLRSRLSGFAAFVESLPLPGRVCENSDLSFAGLVSVEDFLASLEASYPGLAFMWLREEFSPISACAASPVSVAVFWQLCFEAGVARLAVGPAADAAAQDLVKKPGEPES